MGGPNRGPRYSGIGKGGHGKHDANLVNITCESEIDFSCDLHRTGEEGFFVCRTYTNHRTGLNNSFPVCIPTDKARESDECGCCGEEECPEECDACPCTAFHGPDSEPKAGVEVLVDGEDEPMCVPIGMSRMMVARDDAISCYTGCL
jgi:hypothetical protein